MNHAKALADALRFVSEHALTSTARIDLKTKADKALAAYDAHQSVETKSIAVSYSAANETWSDHEGNQIPIPAKQLCEDEGCPNYGTPHVCINRIAEAATRENGDIAAIREHHQVMVEKVEYGYDFGCRLGEFAHRHRGVLLAALSQQGKCFECGSYLQAPICPKCNPEFDISRSCQQQGADSELVRRLRNAAISHTARHNSDTANLFTAAADALSRAPQPDTVTEATARKIAELFDHDYDGWAESEQKKFRADLSAAISVRGK